MTIITAEQACHLIVVPLKAWGHARPLIALVARLVQIRPLVVTFFTPHDLYHRIDTELSRSFEPEQSSIRARIRLVGLPCEENNAIHIDLFFAAFADAYKKLVNEEPVSCTHTGKIMEAVRAPDAAILDIFARSALTSIQTFSRQRVRSYCFTPCAAFATYGVVSQFLEEIEQGNLRSRIEWEAAEKGVPVEDIARRKFQDAGGKVIDSPGLPPMYDYENYPQEIVQKMPQVAMTRVSILELLDQCDGLVVSAPACFEPEEATLALSKWLARTSRTFYSVGPMLPSGKHAVEQEKILSADATKIDTFMERIYKTMGQKSMLFVSFGSLFWPNDASKIWIFLDVLLERKIPFIFSHGAQFATVPDDVAEKVEASSMGVLTSWAPQQAILAHPVTGWFVTHGGFNSIIESVTAGVPMICWPYRAEQPLNAMHLTDNLNIAYELFEVRTGEHALKPVYRTGRTPVGTADAIRAEVAGVLSQAFGKDGARKRANIMRLREATLAAWAEQGTSRRAMERLIDSFHA